MPIRCAAQRPQTMDMDAATGDGDNIMTELKYDETGTTHFNCNINLSRLICDIIFLMSPKRILPPVAIISTRIRRPAKSLLHV